MLKENENVRLWTTEQRDEIISSVVKNLPKSKEKVPFDIAQKYVEKPETFKRKIREIFFPGGNGLVKKIEGAYPESLLEFHDGWVEFYKNFSIAIDLNDFPLPPYERLILEEGKNYWSNLVHESMNPQSSFAIRKQLSEVYEYTSVSKIVDVYPRVKVSVIEAVQNARMLLPNVSCFKSMEMGILGTTFTEGCLIDGRILKEIGMHLDVDGATLYTGSRYSGGYVPRSDWYSGGKFYVYNYGLQHANPNLSLRQKQF